MPTIIVLVVLAAVILFIVVSYNDLVKKRNRVDEAWSDIDVQLKRRYNLIPNLVETVKGYATHEEGVLTKVTEARNMAVEAKNIKTQEQAENMLTGALKSLFAVSENYPDLKANQNFIQLQEELVDTEDKIQASRRFYNSVVRDFNTKIQAVPVNLIAGMFGFKIREFFEIEDETQKENINVSFKKEQEPAPAASTAGAATDVKNPPQPKPSPEQPTSSTDAQPTPPAPEAGEETQKEEEK